MEIFDTFGLDWKIVLAQVVNFLVILFILRKFLYKPLFKIFDKRAQLAREAIEHEDESKKALEKANEMEKKLIKEAKETANQLLKDAREQARTMLKEAEEAAKKQTDRTILEARRQIEQETKEAEAKLTKDVSRLSVELLRKSLSTIFTEDEQKEIVKRAMKDLQGKTN